MPQHVVMRRVRAAVAIVLLALASAAFARDRSTTIEAFFEPGSRIA